jgi:glutamyl-tRNA reductase
MILIVGLSHRTAPLELREALAFPPEQRKHDLASLREQAGVSEAMILSTCNRVELYASAKDCGPLDGLASHLATSRARSLAAIGSALYRLSGDEAVRHAFRVTASLDSMVVGESQILGQVKEAYQLAEEAGTLGGALTALRDRSLAAAKRVRTSTAIGRNAVSVSHVAVELARKIYGDMRGREVLLIGTGKMSEIAARQLVSGGAHATVVGGRRFERACELADALGGTAVPFEALGQELARADVVISGTAAPGIVVSRAQVEQARATRRHRPLFLIDIAVPRDIEPTVRDLANVFLYDLDDLKSVSEANLRERQREAEDAEVIVAESVRGYLDWQRSLDVVPVLVELRQRAEEIRRTEIERARKHLGPLTPQQEAAIQHLTSAIVQKLLHAPSVQLKELARDAHPAADASFIRRLLGL